MRRPKSCCSSTVSTAATKQSRSATRRFFFPASLAFLVAFLLQNIGQTRAQLHFQLDGPQPCPENPIRLNALHYAQYIYSPYDEHRNYPPNTDCQFLIEASDRHYRIHMTVLESEMEEPVFSECTDYISVMDIEGGTRNNETNTKEVSRWCGQDFPAAITSSSDSLLVHFHSDSVIQKRGFNISFVQFALPGCPPDPEWKSDLGSPFCYKQFVLPHILPWPEAQKECSFERANLATFLDESDYAFIVGKFSETHSFPWIGYSDANTEGVFESLDKNSPLWPENFPLRKEDELKDCVYLDWNTKEHFVHYRLDDCRNRRPFICKKRKDGSDVPAQLPPNFIRRGFHDFSFDYTLLVAVIVLLLLSLVIGCLIFHKFKERSNRVVNVDLNQRLVQGGSRQTLSSGHAKSMSDQKAAAAAALAKERTKEKEKREREREVAGGTRNSRAAPKPLEAQDSAASFPLQTFQGAFARSAQIEADSRRQREAAAAAETAAAESPLQSPRISFSPNQPDVEAKLEDGDVGRAARMEQEEDEGDRHNLGYEPDSEDEDTGLTRQQQEEQQLRRTSAYREEATTLEQQQHHFHAESSTHVEHEQVQVEYHPAEPAESHSSELHQDDVKLGKTGAASAQPAADELVGQFATRQPAEHPVRPPIELMRNRKVDKSDEVAREETMLSMATGQAESGTGTGGRMRGRRKSFDRPPPVGPLDSVSAISLDEFWQQNQK